MPHLYDFTLKIMNAGGNPKPGDKLAVFTHESGATVDISGFPNTAANFDMTGVSSWGDPANLSLTNDVSASAIYLIGLKKPPAGTLIMVK